MAQQRISSSFDFDEDLFAEYLEAKDRSLNKRDALFYASVMGVVFACWICGCIAVGSVNAVGIVVGAIIAALLAFSVFIALTGRTILWPKAAWRKTYQRFFTRHGVDSSEARPWSFACRTSATPNHLEVSVLHDGEPTSTITKSYKEFSHIEQTDHLIVVVAACEVEPVWKSLFSPDYADLLAKREATEDAVFMKGSLKGMNESELIDYLGRKVRIR